MIRAALLCSLATQAGAVDLPAMGPEITACLQQHVTSAPYVAALASAGWSPVRPFDRELAQRNLAHALVAALELEADQHAPLDSQSATGPVRSFAPEPGWATRWRHRNETLAWIEDASANRTLYERGDAILLLVGEQITDETVGRIHRTTCLFGAPLLEDVGRLLADAPVVEDLKSITYLPEDEEQLPATSVSLMRNVPPADADAPTHLDAIITTRVFPVRDAQVIE